MNRTLALAALFLVLPACLVRTVNEPLPPNELGPGEHDGTQLLFDGKTTDGWRGYKQASCPAGWQVLAGALTRVGEGGDLATVEEYQDFVLDFEWRVTPGANSGVLFHVTEDHGAPWETGPEYQILDDTGHEDGHDPLTSAASNYAMHAPVGKVLRAVGEWNQARIMVCGPHVEHWLNGQKVVEYELWSDDWKARVARCKWKDHPDYGRRASGHIVLQDHGDEVAYRSLKISRILAAR